MSMSAVRVSTVVIAAPWKRRNGKIMHRSRIISKGIETVTKQIGKEDAVELEVTVNDRQFKGTLRGAFDRNKGNIRFEIVDEATTSYLKKKGFKVAGYTLDLRITNLNRRQQHEQPKQRSGLHPQSRGPVRSKYGSGFRRT